VAGFAVHTTSLIGRAHRTMGPLLLIILLFAIAWVVLILPKQRELKRHNALIGSLEVGDEVMTGSGIYGTLTEVTDDRVRLEVAPGLELTMARRAVAAKIPAPAAATDDAAAAPGDAAPADDTPDTTAEAPRADADEDVDQ
jgi:preprotein translocase subunit YajC